MHELVRKIQWLIRRPDLFPHFLYLIGQKINPSDERSNQVTDAWYENRAINLAEAIAQISGDSEIPSFWKKFKKELDFAKKKSSESPVSLGGPGSVELLYVCAEKIEATKVVETGVAYGWSSLSILLSISDRDGAQLISTDIPHVSEPHIHRLNEKYVGCVVPEGLKKKWMVINNRDKVAIPKALKQFQKIDLCHYDSDKSYQGRMFAYPLLWEALRNEGVFISDDISDNEAFKVFCSQIGCEPIIVKTNNKYVGVIIKK